MIAIKPISKWSGWAWVSGLVALALVVVGTNRFIEGAQLWALLDYVLAVINGYFFYKDVRIDNKDNGFDS